jgi:hypothetical protein
MSLTKRQRPVLRPACASRILPLLLLLALSATVQAEDYTYITNNGTITITRYIGPGGAVTIPATITDLPVATIGNNAFGSCTNVTSVTIPKTVTGINYAAFANCTNLISVTIGDSVTFIGDNAFSRCHSLTNVTMPNSLATIPYMGFYNCTSLSRITLPESVTVIDWYAFRDCTNLTAVYFQGDAPTLGPDAFLGDNNAIVYYLPGTTGWDLWTSPPPAVLWNPQVQTRDTSFGVRTNRFGFNITGTTSIPTAVEACTNLASANWVSLQTCSLTNGSIYFSDPDWTNHPARFYRLRSP